jgi:hypothetical protein
MAKDTETKERFIELRAKGKSYETISNELWCFKENLNHAEPEAYRRDVSNAQVHILDAGHFALDTAADEIAALVRGFVGSSLIS